MGNRVKLTEWQDKFHAHISERFEELEHGEPTIETKRKHIPIRLFKQATALTQQKEEIQAVLDGINVLSAAKKRKRRLNRGRYIMTGCAPLTASSNKWSASIRILQEAINSLKHRENNLERRLYREQQGHSEEVNAMLALQSGYDDCLAFIGFNLEGFAQTACRAV